MSLGLHDTKLRFWLGLNLSVLVALLFGLVSFGCEGSLASREPAKGLDRGVQGEDGTKTADDGGTKGDAPLADSQSRDLPLSETGVAPDATSQDSTAAAALSLTLSASPSTVVYGASTTLEATVSNAQNGIQSVSLKLEATTIGPMSPSSGSYQRAVSWSEANNLSTFNFLSAETRTFSATVRDGAGRTATAQASVQFRCNSSGTLAACTGQCVDLSSDNSNCGDCDHPCPDNDCSEGFCGGPTSFSACFQVSDAGQLLYEDCHAYCTAMGKTCSDSACETGDNSAGHGFGTLSSCQSYLSTGSPGSGAFYSVCCGANFDSFSLGLPNYAICCCI